MESSGNAATNRIAKEIVPVIQLIRPGAEDTLISSANWRFSIMVCCTDVPQGNWSPGQVMKTFGISQARLFVTRARTGNYVSVCSFPGLAVFSTVHECPTLFAQPY